MPLPTQLSNVVTIVADFFKYGESILMTYAEFVEKYNIEIREETYLDI